MNSEDPFKKLKTNKMKLGLEALIDDISEAMKVCEKNPTFNDLKGERLLIYTGIRDMAVELLKKDQKKIEDLKHWLNDEMENAKCRVLDMRKLGETEASIIANGEAVQVAFVIEKVNELF